MAARDAHDGSPVDPETEPTAFEHHLLAGEDLDLRDGVGWAGSDESVCLGHVLVALDVVRVAHCLAGSVPDVAGVEGELVEVERDGVTVGDEEVPVGVAGSQDSDGLVS